MGESMNHEIVEPKPRALRIPKAKWERVKDKILELYLQTTLENLMNEMSMKYNFRARYIHSLNSKDILIASLICWS